MRFRLLASSLLLLAVPSLARTQEPPPTGHVQIPVEVYNRLVEAAGDPSQPPRPTPASFALGSARVTLNVGGVEESATGQVRVELTIDVLEDD